MGFSKEFINKLKTSINLKELIEEYTDINPYGPDKWICRCPFPNHRDSSPSFYINNNKWHCFGCNEGGDCIDFIQKIEPEQCSNWIDAILYLAKKYNIAVPNNKDYKAYNQNKLLANKFSKDITEEALDYLYSRGLDDEDIKLWQIGYDKSMNRIVFPLMNKHNNIVGFNKRLIKDDKKQSKYINSKTSNIFKKSQYLYGLNNINNDLDYIIITEGVMDVILATKYGLNNVVCTLGTALTEQHIPILKQLNKEIIIIYDGDEKGKESIIRAANLLADNNLYCKVAFIEESKDLADISNELKSKLKSYINSKTYTYGYYRIKTIIEDYNKNLYELKLKYQPTLNGIIKETPITEQIALKSFIENEIGIRIGD